MAGRVAKRHKISEDYERTEPAVDLSVMFPCISTNTNGPQALSGIPRHLISKLEVFCGDKDVRISRLRHLLKSNATPSDSEVIAIRALIADAEACIEELHRHFPAVDRASQAIESQLLKIIEAHRAPLSPVRYLPSEILQEIFLHYADYPRPNLAIATMPWRLGHISHRWRKFALSFPSLWDNIPKINKVPKPKKKERSYVLALFCLIRRSGTSPTLKFDIGGYANLSSVCRRIIQEIMLHSKRIEQLRIQISKTTMQLIQGFKGLLPNLRILRVYLNGIEVPNLDVFETALALRHVTIGGAYQGAQGTRKVLLPWSQITHFEDQLPGERVGQLVPLSSLSSLTYFHIDKRSSCHYYRGFAPGLLSPYRPTTLPNLRTLRILFHDSDYKEVDLFLESLTVPAIEVMEILCMGPLIPRLVSMFSASHRPYRLQKLAFRTIPLHTGELSALLNLTPHLVELDIDVPPADDLLRLIYGEGEVMLVPMLQALYMHSPMLTVGTQTEYIDTLAQVRCELGSRKDSEDAMPSLGPGNWTTLHTLRVVFGSAESRDSSQKVLNNWSSSFTPEEAKAIDMIRYCINYIRRKPFVLESSEDDEYLMLDQLLACIEHYKLTNKVLRETNSHIDLRHQLIGLLMKIPDQDTYKWKQRIIDILAEWDQLLLNDFSGCCWARTSSGPELRDFSLVYVSKSKFHALRKSSDAGLSIIYGLKLSFEESSLWTSNRYLDIN